MSADPAIVYGADRIGLRFAVKDALHPVGHHGQDYHLPAGGGSEVVAYEEVTIVESGVEVTRGYTSMLGWYVVGRARDGRYLGWAHLRRGTRASVGDVVRPGGRIGLAASGPATTVSLAPDKAGVDYPGTAWAGAHIHTTNSDTIPGIFAGNTIDPLPRIQAALVSLAGTGKLTPITPIQEDDLATVTDAQWAALYDATMQIRDALGAQGGLNTKAADSVLGIVRTLPKSIPTPPTPPTAAEIAHAVWWDQTVERKNGDATDKIPAIQELADTKTNILAILANGGVDIDKLATAIAAKLPAPGAPVDVAAIVRAELARVFVAAAG